MEKLTKRQEDTLNFIKEYIVAHGYPPTVREIAKELDVSSPATVQAHLDRLADKGYIKKGSNKNRTIELMVDNEFKQNNESQKIIICRGIKYESSSSRRYRIFWNSNG